MNKLNIITILFFFVAGCGGDATPAAPTPDIADDVAAAPQLIIDTPADGSWSASSLVLVTGRLIGGSEDEGSVVAGDLVSPITDGFFSFWYPLEPGENTLVVTHDPSGASATVTVSLDALPPLLAMDAPARGQVFPDGGAVEVSFSVEDEGGIAALRVQGEDLAPAGPFAALVTPGPGLRHIMVEAEDTLGNLAREHRSVLMGPLIPCDALAEIPAISIGAGADVLDLAAAELAMRLSAMDLGEVLAPYNPVYSTDVLQIDLEDIVWDDLALDLGPGDGHLDLVITAEEIEVMGVVSAGEATLDVILTLTEVSVGASLIVSIPEPGVLDVATENLEISVFEITVTALDSEGEEVIAPTDVGGEILVFLGDFLADLISEQSADLLAGVAGYGEGSMPLDFFGEPVLVEYQVLDAVVQPAGLRLDMAGAFTLEGTTVHEWEHDCPGGATALPDVPPSGGMHVWISYPFLDRILLGLWARGLLDFEVDQALMDENKAEVTLVCGMLGTLLDLADIGAAVEAPLTIGISSPLPPLLSPSEDLEAGVALSLGDLTMDFSCAGRSEVEPRAHLSLTATLGFEVTASRLTPIVEFGDLLLDVSGLPTEDKRRVEGGIEVALEGLFTELLPSLSAALAPIDLPDMMGYRITDGIAGNDPGSDWFRLHATVMEAD